jgi:hypothetical protein
MDVRTGWKLAALACGALWLTGCRTDGRLLPPAGTIEKQRFSSTVFDPYTDNDIGPEVVGGRPKDFQKPLPDSDRSRLLRKAWSPL